MPNVRERAQNCRIGLVGCDCRHGPARPLPLLPPTRKGRAVLKGRDVTHSPQPPPTRDGSTNPRTSPNPKAKSVSISGITAGATDLGRTTEIDSVICRGRGTLAYRHRNDYWGFCCQPFGRGAAF